MTFCFVVAHSVGEGGPRFLVVVELSILCHVACAYGVLLSVCSFCEGMGHGILFGHTSLQFLLVWKACT